MGWDRWYIHCTWAPARHAWQSQSKCDTHYPSSNDMQRTWHHSVPSWKDVGYASTKVSLTIRWYGTDSLNVKCLLSLLHVLQIVNLVTTHNGITSVLAFILKARLRLWYACGTIVQLYIQLQSEALGASSAHLLGTLRSCEVSCKGLRF